MARLPRGKQVTIHLNGEQSVRGLLVGRVGLGGYVQLRNAQIEANGAWVPADGDVYVPKDAVAVVQC